MAPWLNVPSGRACIARPVGTTTVCPANVKEMEPSVTETTTLPATVTIVTSVPRMPMVDVAAR